MSRFTIASAIVLLCAPTVWAVVGDANGDGYVGHADYTIWADQFDTAGPEGDISLDGIVDVADYSIWSVLFGAGTAPTPLPPGPTLRFTATPLGSGITAYDFYIDNADGLNASYAVTAAFSGPINQVPPASSFFGNSQWRPDPIDPAFQVSAPLEDSWAYEPFCNNEIPGLSVLDGSLISGFNDWGGHYQMSLGSGAASALGDDVPLAHIATLDGQGALEFRAQIARDGALYDTGWMTVPEPTTLALLGLGVAAMLKRRRQ